MLFFLLYENESIATGMYIWKSIPQVKENLNVNSRCTTLFKGIVLISGTQNDKIELNLTLSNVFG